MSRKVLAAAAVLLVTGTFAAVPAHADQGNQSLSLNLGYFALRGEDARVPGDVLVENLNYLSFWPADLNSVTFGGEWLVGLGDYMEIGAGVGFYAKSVPSVYTDYVNSDGSEIMQRLKLQIVPVTATIRFLPLRRGAGIASRRGRDWALQLAIQRRRANSWMPTTTSSGIATSPPGRMSGRLSWGACGSRWDRASAWAARSATSAEKGTSVWTSTATASTLEGSPIR